MLNWNRFREKYYVDLDLFGNFLPKVDSPEDQKIIDDMRQTILTTSDLCFGVCANVNKMDFTQKEETCVSNCVKNLHLMTTAILKKFDHPTEHYYPPFYMKEDKLT